MSGLATVLADPVKRARRRRLAREAGARWQGQPMLDALRCRLEQSEADDPQAALAAALPLLADIDWLRSSLGALSRLLAADPLIELPLRPLGGATAPGLQLFRHRSLTLVAQSLPPSRTTTRAVVFAGRHSLVRFVEPRGVVLDLWDIAPIGPGFRANTAGRCRPAGRIEATNAVLAIDGRCRTWSLADAPYGAAIVQATTSAGAAPLVAEFATDGGALLGTAALDGAATRLQLAAGVLRRMGRRDAAPALAAVLHDCPFHQRWQLTRELVGLDRAAARPVLATMAAADPHPEVRDAARATLARLRA